MPQLDNVTYLSQIVWFIAFFLLFYQLLLQIVLPNVVTIFKARRKISQITHKVNFIAITHRPNNNLYLNTYTLYTLALTQANTYLSKGLSLFKNLENSYLSEIQSGYLNTISQNVLKKLNNLMLMNNLVDSHLNFPVKVEAIGCI